MRSSQLAVPFHFNHKTVASTNQHFRDRPNRQRGTSRLGALAMSLTASLKQVDSHCEGRTAHDVIEILSSDKFKIKNPESMHGLKLVTTLFQEV